MQDKNCKGQIPSKIFETLGSRRMWAPRGGFECAVSAQRRGVTSQPALEDRGGDEKSVWRGGSQAVLAVAARGKFQVGVLGSELSRSHTRGGRGSDPGHACCLPAAAHGRLFIIGGFSEQPSETPTQGQPEGAALDCSAAAGDLLDARALLQRRLPSVSSPRAAGSLLRRRRPPGRAGSSRSCGCRFWRKVPKSVFRPQETLRAASLFTSPQWPPALLCRLVTPRCARPESRVPPPPRLGGRGCPFAGSLRPLSSREPLHHLSCLSVCCYVTRLHGHQAPARSQGRCWAWGTKDD